MAISLEIEKRLVLLLSMYDLGGAGTKQQVLDNIEQKEYYTLRPHDQTVMDSRQELTWRNDLAFIRKHLMESGYMTYERRNWWKISLAGEEYLLELCDLVTRSRLQRFDKLTEDAIIRAQEILIEFDSRQELDLIEGQVIMDLGSLSLEEEHFEGRERERYSSYYERDPKLRAEAILIHGTICTVCGFSFEAKYGERGKGFIEVHHLKPVSELGGNAVVNPATDLTVVCSNCHRMIHRKTDNVLSLANLRQVLASKSVRP